MAEFIYSMVRARKAVGDKVILDDVTMSFYPGAKIGVVGPNGAGKSTILKIMAGLDQPSNGEAFITPGFSVGILMQEPELDESKTVLENIQLAFGDINAKLARYNEVLAEMETEYTDELLEEMGTLSEELDHAGAWDLDAKIDQAMDALRCPPGDSPVDVLSGGERRRVALCRVLLSHPDLLLLDEPTNHLDAESVSWLERFLSDYAGTVVAITHDRYFLDNAAQWILELDHGRCIPFEGNYSGWLEQKDERLRQEDRQDSARQRTLASELEWVRMSPRARQAKARLSAYEKLLADANAAEARADRLEIVIPSGKRLGDIVIEAEDLTKG